MKQEQGAVVSDASELLFEDIKKLNAQQRPDVPTCLIYAPISLLLMSTKHQHISTLKHTAHSQRVGDFILFFPTVCRVCVCHLELWNNLRTFLIRLQLKTNETETGVLLFDVQGDGLTDAQTALNGCTGLVPRYERSRARSWSVACENVCNVLHFRLPSLSVFLPEKSTPIIL